MDICYQALSLVTEYIEDPKDFVKTCLVNKSLYRNRRKALLALEATRPDGHKRLRYNRASIMSKRFKDQKVWEGLNEIWRFHADNEILKLYISIEQTNTTDHTDHTGRRESSRKLSSDWRPILRKLVNMFYERCKLMRRPLPNLHRSMCRFDIEADKDDHVELDVGACICDDDMVIFESVTCFHLSNAVRISDNGVMKLVSAEEIFLSGCTKVRGEAFIYLQACKVLYALELVGRPGEHIYDQDIIRYLQKPLWNRKRTYKKDRPVPFIFSCHIHFQKVPVFHLG